MTNPSIAPQWHAVELTFSGPGAEVENPYLEVEGWVDFVHSNGSRLRRPLYYDGDDCWRVRFSSTVDAGSWAWQVGTLHPEHAMRPDQGILTAARPTPGQHHPGRLSGLLRVADSGRALCLADGTPLFLVIDTAWGMPWRATVADAEVYAADRSAKGFNAVLLMSVQPDMHAGGPLDRTADEGFDVGFWDLSDGHLNNINIDYFRYLDKLLEVLLAHGITPIMQPVFHGFGWKGLDVAGTVVPPSEYARYARYLVARYGASPVIYLPGGDGTGTEPQVEAAGREIQRWDAYRNRPASTTGRTTATTCTRTPTGSTSSPARPGTRATTSPTGSPPCGAARQAVINGEPSYEHTGRRGVAEGWWQGHEAWSNVCAGALMGVAYGAAGCGNGGCPPTSRVTSRTSWPRTPGGGRRCVRGEPLRRSRRQDPGRAPVGGGGTVLGRVDQQPRPVGPRCALPRVRRTRRAMVVPRRRGPGAVALLDDRPPDRTHPEQRRYIPLGLGADRERRPRPRCVDLQ